MGKIKQFEDLDIWKEATAIAIEIYAVSEQGKLKNDWGLKDQLRRAAMSISDNIAEGFEYDNNKDFIKFLRYAKGSSGELRNKLYVLYRIEYIHEELYHEFHTKLISLSRKIAGFIKYLKEYEKSRISQLH
ncbi:MAG: four helix bundle protein [Bacteroidota bacterium]